MKKVTALLMLTAATSLAACSHHGYNNDNYGNGNYGYESSNYGNSSSTNSQYAENTENANRSHWHQDRQDRVSMMVNTLFKKCDTNHNGYISWKEYEACAHRMFRKADSNHDGKLSRREVYAHKRHRMHMMHREMDRRGDTTSYNNTRYSNTPYASGNGTNSYRDERSYQDMTPSAGEENEGVNDNAYSHDAGNMNRYNETH